jgi:uncharacterized protein (TIGR02001 family)
MLSKKSKMLRLATLSLAVAGAMSVSHSASAVEVSGSVGVANMYLWRGVDLGQGDAAVSGDLSVSAGGFYGGIWGSSGDAANGTEYDLYVGYGAEFGGVSVDLSVWNYMYPSSAETDEDGNTVDNELDDFGGLSEVVLSLGFAGFGVSVYDAIADAGAGSGYEYYTVSYSYDAFTVLAGLHDNVGGTENMTHVDVKYALNDNLTFTLSQQADSGDDSHDDDLKFVVSYSLPIGE